MKYFLPGQKSRREKNVRTIVNFDPPSWGMLGVDPMVETTNDQLWPLGGSHHPEPPWPHIRRLEGLRNEPRNDEGPMKGDDGQQE